MALREIYLVKYEPFFDTIVNKYKNIISINELPKGPLNKLIKKVYKEKISDKETIKNDEKCAFSIMSLKNKENYMSLNELPLLYAFLKNNNYKINHVNLKWEDKTICFIEYFL